jgi:choline monooxygenase
MKTVPERPGAPVEEAWTLPAPWYVDPEHHRRELADVLGRSWQFVCRADEVAEEGAYASASVAGEPLLFVRGRDGALRGFHNVCRHRAGAVVRGVGCARALSCTYHGWTYGLDGKLLAAPEMEGVRNFAFEDFGLLPVRCEAWGAYVFACLDTAAPPLAEALGPMPRLAAPSLLERFSFGLRETYPIRCNWKVYVDNYLEGYHVPRAHPGLNKVIDYRRYAVVPEGPVVTQSAPDRRPPSKAVTKAREDDFLYLWLFPNFMLNVSPDYAQTNLVVPTGPQSCDVVFDYWFPAGASQESKARREESIRWSDGIQREDIQLCEEVQQNLRSRAYHAGRYSARRENGVHHFHEMMRRMLKR